MIPFLSSGMELARSISALFPIDTRDKSVRIEDVRSEFCAGEWGHANGTRATFLSGVPCPIEFTATLSDRNAEVIRWRVNGEETTENPFVMDVGLLPPGGTLEVIAVARVNGEQVETDPFRVNLCVAPPPDGASPMRVVSRTGGAVHYLGTDYSVVRIFDTIDDFLEIGDIQLPFMLLASFRLVQSFDSATGIYREGRGPGIRAHNDEGFQRMLSEVAEQRIARLGSMDIDLEVTGEETTEWDPARGEWTNPRSSLGLHVMGDASIGYRIPETAWLVKVEGGIKSDVSALISWNDDLEFEGRLDLDPIFALYGRITAGVPYCYAAGTVGGGLALKEHFPDPAGRHIDEFKGYFWAEYKWRVFGMGNDDDEQNGRVEWPVYFVGGPQSSTATERRMSTFAAAAALPDESFFATARPVPRDYLGRGVESARTRVAKSANAAQVVALKSTDGQSAESVTVHVDKGTAFAETLVSGGYPNPAPAVAASGGLELVAHLRDDGTRPDMDRTEVVVRKRKDSGNSWIEERVWDDGTADFMPALALATNGTAVLAWANAGKPMADGATLADVCRSMEIAVGVSDPESGVWTCRNLTDDDALDMAPVVSASPDGMAFVAWLRNESGAFFGSAANPTKIAVTRYSNGTWGEPETVATNAVGVVTGIDLINDGDCALLVWTGDEDGDLATKNDQAVFAMVWEDGTWGEVRVLSESGMAVGVPMARLGEDSRPMAIWVQDGALRERTADGAEASVPLASAPGLAGVPDTARSVHGPNGSLALIWAYAAKGCDWFAPVPVAMQRDSATGLWGAPLAIEVEPGREARAVSGSFGPDGALRLAWESVAVSTNDTGGISEGDCALRWVKSESVAAPAVFMEDFAWGTNAVVSGTYIPIAAKVRNLGRLAVTNVTLAVRAGDGEPAEGAAEGFALIDSCGEVPKFDLPGGAVVTTNLFWMATDSFSNLLFRAELELPAGTDDPDTDDNSARWRPGRASLWLEAPRSATETAMLRLLTATVRNDGLAAAEPGTRVSFRRGSANGQEIGTALLKTVKTGEKYGHEAGIEWDMTGENFTSAWEMVWIVIEGDSAAMNGGTAQLRVMTALDSDGDGLLDGEEELLGTNPQDADTDGDGMDDHAEVYVYETDPLRTPRGGRRMEAPGLSPDDSRIWWSGGNADWIMTEDVVDATGGRCARSGEIVDGQESWMETSVEGAGTLSFRWKVSSQPRLDTLSLLVDGDKVKSVAGQTGWTEVEIGIEDAGTHVLRWVYSKSPTVTSGEDCGWLDDVRWTPIVVPPNFGAALDAEILSWANGGDGQWIPCVSPSHDGEDACIVKPFGAGGVAWIETTVQGPGEVSFWWRNNPDSSTSGIAFMVDGKDLECLYDSKGWEMFLCPVDGDGVHVLRWEYFWDGNPGSDSGSLDTVCWTGGAEAGGKTHTTTTPVPVPLSWLDANAASHLAAHGGDYEAAANATSANGVNKVWQCYVAGIDPEDEDAKFKATIEMDADGKPVVKWNPPLSAEEEAKRTYRTLGKKTLDPNEEWTDVTDESDLDAAEYRFFKVSVEMR
ncbi:MAG: hypothetical protein IKH04_00205 [Kiritimatiellae bacterium]|nr:hypothetical protein [Kiritimatiellia bacterium]